MRLHVNQGGTNRNHCTETCNLARRDLLMTPDRMPKIGNQFDIICPERSGCEQTFSSMHLAEPHSPWDACGYYIIAQSTDTAKFATKLHAKQALRRTLP